MRAVLLMLIFVAFSAGAASAAPRETICDYLARHPVTKNRAGDLVFPSGYVRDDYERRHNVDLDGDGMPDKVAQGMDGVANFVRLSSLKGEPSLYNSKRDPTQPEPPLAIGYDQGGGTRGEIWVRLGNRYYDVHYGDNEDYAELEYVKYYLPDGHYRYACVFQNDVQTQDWKYAAAPSGLREDAVAVCPPRSVPFEQPPFIPAVERISKEDAERLPSERFRETSFDTFCEFGKADCKDIWQVDFDNDGVTERLLKRGAYSGAGRGCDLEGFVLLDSYNRPVGGAKQAALDKIRGECGSQLNWVKIRGRTALLRQPPQDLAMVRGGDAALLCSSVFRMIPKIVYVDPLLKK